MENDKCINKERAIKKTDFGNDKVNNSIQSSQVKTLEVPLQGSLESFTKGKARAITKSGLGNDKVTFNSIHGSQIKTLEAPFQGMESPTKGKTSVTSTLKNTNVTPEPAQNSETSNLGKTNVTSNFVKNKITPSETRTVAFKPARVVSMPVDDVDYSILGKYF